MKCENERRVSARITLLGDGAFKTLTKKAHAYPQSSQRLVRKEESKIKAARKDKEINAMNNPRHE
jgi:hypothetical protein